MKIFMPLTHIKFLRYFRKTVFPVLFFGVSSSSYAQKIWTLQECVDYALKNNIQIKQSVLSSELSKVTANQSMYNMFPTLNGSASHSYNYGRSVDPFTYQFTEQQIQSNNFSLNANVTLFNGFELMNTLKQSKLDYMASRYDVQKISNDVSLNVVSAYLQVLYSKEQLTAADDRVKAAQQQRSHTKIMVDAGSLAQGNLLEVESQLANEELAKVNAENLVSSSTLSLIQLLQLDSIGINDFKIEDPKPEIPDQASLTLTPDQVYDASLKTLPEIRSADYKVQSAEKGVSIARGNYYPRLSAFGSLGTGYSSGTQQIKSFGGDPIGNIPNGDFVPTPIDTFFVFSPLYSSPTYEKTPFKDQIDQNYNKSIGLSLNIPIFNGFQSRTNVIRAKINLENAKYNSELTKNTVYKSIQQAHLDAIASLKKYNALETSVSSLNETYNYSEKKFNAGLLTSLEFLTAKNNLSKAQSDLIQAKYEFIFKLKVLDFYQGKSLTF